MQFNAINYPRFPQALRRLFAMVAQPATPTLAPEIQVDLDLFRYPEIAGLMDQTGFWGMATCAALAANFSAVGIRNLPNSGLIVVVTHLATSVAGAAASLFQQNSQTTSGSQIGSATTNGQDSRFVGQFGGGHPVRITTYQSVTAGIGFVGPVYPSPVQNSWNEIPGGHVLAPGSELIICHGTVNTAITAGFRGYSRPASSFELLLGA